MILENCFVLKDHIDSINLDCHHLEEKQFSSQHQLCGYVGPKSW